MKNKLLQRVRWLLIVPLLTVLTQQAWATTYTWTLASGDLGSSGSPSASVSKGSPSTTWSASYTWGGSTATKYLGWDSSKGVQIGAGSATNKCSSLVLSTSGISGTITNITVNGCHASSGGASIVIKVGSTTVKTSTNFTTSATDYSTGTISQSGTIEITISNSAAKAFYLKSISVTYSATPATVTLHDANGSTNVSGQYSGASYTLPTTAAACTGKTFLGWSTSEIATTDTKPSYSDKGASVTLSATNNFYAVYATENGTTTSSTSYTHTFSDVATSITATDGSTFTLTWTKGNSNTVYNGGVRLYGGGKLQVSSSKTMTAIEFTQGTSNWNNSFTASVGSYDDTNKKWTGSATSVTFTESGTSGHKNIATIKITYNVTVADYNQYTTSCCTPLGTINGSKN